MPRVTLRLVCCLALASGLGCGAEAKPPSQEPEPVPVVAESPTPPDPVPPPPIPQQYADCTRGQQSRGLLAELPDYRFEYGPDYSEIERARLEVARVSISYSGCDHFTREYRFELSPAMTAVEADAVFRRAAELMTELAAEVDGRTPLAAARDIEAMSASGDFALGDDLTGQWFEGEYGIGVLLESGGSVVVVVQTFIL